MAAPLRSEPRRRTPPGRSCAKPVRMALLLREGDALDMEVGDGGLHRDPARLLFRARASRGSRRLHRVVGLRVGFAISMIPFTICVLRYAVDVDGGEAGEPEEIVLGDCTLQILAVACLAAVGVPRAGIPESASPGASRGPCFGVRSEAVSPDMGPETHRRCCSEEGPERGRYWRPYRLRAGPSIGFLTAECYRGRLRQARSRRYHAGPLEGGAHRRVDLDGWSSRRVCGRWWCRGPRRRTTLAARGRRSAATPRRSGRRRGFLPR